MSIALTSLIPLEDSAGGVQYLVGGSILAVLLLVMLALLAFGGGREHT